MTVHGYIGLGMMGSAMCERLARSGAAVLAHDLNPAAVDAAVERGATAAGSTEEVAEQADIISTCVPAAAHLDAVIDELATVGRAGQILLIHSTVHPDTIRAAQTRVAAWEGLVFDAAVAGGDEAARQGELAIFAGGLTDAPPIVAEVLDIYGSKVIDAGPIGSGAALKIAVNVMTYAQFTAAAIAHDGVANTGGDPTALLEAWRHTGMLGALTEQWAGLLGIGPEHVTGEFRTMLETQVGIATKDLELAMTLGDPAAGPVAVVDAIRALMPAVYRTITMEEA